MQGKILAALCAGLVTGCVAGPVQLPASPSLAAEQAAVASTSSTASTASTAGTASPASTASPEITEEIVTVDVAALAAAQRDVVCRDRRRPGSRIVVGQECKLRSQTGITTEALRELDRELTGQGFSPGWKTEGQIDAEGALGVPMGPL